jgi:CBS domain-containing protein
MARDPVIVHGEDDAEPLLAIFEGHDLNAVAVVDAGGYLLGMVTKLSLLRLFRGGSATGTTETETPASLRIRDVMDTRKVWVEQAEGLDTVRRQMARHHARSGPVVERSASPRRLVEMVSRGDLLRGAARPPASA